MRQTADPHAGFAPVRRTELPPTDRTRDNAQVELLREALAGHAGFAPVRRTELPPTDRTRDSAQVELLREALAGRDAYARQQVKAKVAEVDARARRAACR